MGYFDRLTSLLRSKQPEPDFSEPLQRLANLVLLRSCTEHEGFTMTQGAEPPIRFFRDGAVTETLSFPARHIARAQTIFTDMVGLEPGRPLQGRLVLDRVGKAPSAFVVFVRPRANGDHLIVASYPTDLGERLFEPTSVVMDLELCKGAVLAGDVARARDLATRAHRLAAEQDPYLYLQAVDAKLQTLGPVALDEARALLGPLQARFGPHSPMTSLVIATYALERSRGGDIEGAMLLWRPIRGAFVVLFGEDEPLVEALDRVAGSSRQ